MTTALPGLRTRRLVLLGLLLGLGTGSVIHTGVATAAAATAAATTVTALQDQGRLSLRSWLQPEASIVPGQRVALIVEVGTERWFAGGTRIRTPEVPGLVLLQRNGFAANATEQRGGVSWTLQRWTLDLYAQRSGSFVLPPLEVSVEVNDGDNTISGTLTTPALRFRASVPALLEPFDTWVAAPEFNVKQSFDRELEGLVVGDAITREVRFSARDVLPMMLPELAATEAAGLAIYPQPPALDSSSNRGVTLATRTERITYVLEQPGDYVLPAQDFAWWDTGSAALELRSLPQMVLRVGGTAAPTHQKPKGLIPGIESLRGMLPAFGMLALGGVLLLLIYRYVPVGRLVMQSRAAVIGLWQSWREGQLPKRLNPGSSAGE